MSVCKWCDVNRELCIFPDFTNMGYPCDGYFKDCLNYEVCGTGEADGESNDLEICIKRIIAERVKQARQDALEEVETIIKDMEVETGDINDALEEISKLKAR